MKQVCLACERSSPDKNLFCQETYCPAEMSPTILDYGEWLGDIEIVKPIMVLRAAVLYEATHQHETVFVKVAHPGEGNKARLQREAETLRDLRLSDEVPEMLPCLLPAYANTTVAQDPYGKIMLQGHLLYFYICEHFDGEPLRDVLVKHPQLWINHVGWIALSLATAINLLHNKERYHFGLCPDCVLVRFDQKPDAPRVFLADLGIASPAPQVRAQWYPDFVAPAYTAPELINHRNQPRLLDYRTDVYGLGIVLYEMLIGQAPYTYKLRSDNEVVEAVMHGQRIRLNRDDVLRDVAQLALRSTDEEVGRRPADATDIANELLKHFGPVPPPKKSRWPGGRRVLIIIGIVILAILLLILALSTGS